MSRAKRESLERCHVESPGERRVWHVLARVQGELEAIGTRGFAFVPNPGGFVWAARQLAPITPDFLVAGDKGAAVIEVDGRQHAQSRARDAHRDALIGMGLRVVRIDSMFTTDDSELLLLVLPVVQMVTGLERLDVLPCWADARAAVRVAISEAA